jgi:hypothetical protein
MTRGAQAPFNLFCDYSRIFTDSLASPEPGTAFVLHGGSGQGGQKGGVFNNRALRYGLTPAQKALILRLF